MKDIKVNQVDILDAVRYQGAFKHFKSPDHPNTYQDIPKRTWIRRAARLANKVSPSYVLPYDEISVGEVIDDFVIEHTKKARQSLLDNAPHIKKPTPESLANIKLQAEAAKAGVTSPDKIKALKEQIADVEKRDVVISREGLRQAGERAKLTQFEIDRLIKAIPENKAVLVSSDNFEDIDTTSIDTSARYEDFIPQQSIAEEVNQPEQIQERQAGGTDSLSTPTVGKATAKLATQAITSAIKGPQGVAATILIKNKGKVAAAAAGLLVGAGLLVAGAGIGVAALATAGSAALAYTAGSGTGITALTSIGSGIVTGISAIAGSGFGAIGIGIGTGVVAAPILIALILFIINSGAYVVPPSLNSTNSVIGLGGSTVSPYIGVTKVADPSGPFDNGDEKLKKIHYTITITAKKGTLTNITVQNVCQTIREQGNTSCGAPTPTDIPQTIDSGGHRTFEYDQDYSGEQFKDSFVNDTFTVTADTPDQNTATASTNAIVKIGKPPEDCPNGWPVTSGTIWNGAGPGGISTHYDLEAIDIGTYQQAIPVYATHSGIAKVEETEFSGKIIRIESNCNGVTFTSNYIHLSVQSVQDNTEVVAGQEIGTTGHSGTSGGSLKNTHLHYDFRLGTRFDPQRGVIYPNHPDMNKPYIPVDVPRGCSNSYSDKHCNIQIGG